MNRAQASELQKALAQRQSELASAFGQPQQAEAARPKGHKSGQGQSGGEGQTGSEASSLAEANNHSRNGAPARGGDRGELSFEGEARMDPERLKFEPLPKGQGGEAGPLWGLRQADPKSRPGVSTSSSKPLLEGHASPGHHEGPLLPRNRELVKQFFGSQ